MQTLTASERVLRRVLIEAARQANGPTTMTYTELGGAAQKAGYAGSYPMIVKPFRGLGTALGHISRYEHSLGRPLISAIVVQQGSGHPGDGFIQLAADLGRNTTHAATFCEIELADVMAFWRDPDPTRVADAAFGRVLELLHEIRGEL